jgi:lipoprotein-anchoring transpeptidase ErfK/SrfK
MRSPPRLALALIAGAVPLVPIAIGLSLGGTSQAPVVTTTRSSFTPATTPIPTEHLKPIPDFGGALVATLKRPVSLLKRPGGHRYGRLTTTTPFGSRQVMLVVRSSGRWLGVRNPVAGNGRLGWIPLGAATLREVSWRIDVSLTRRRVTISDNGRVLRRFRIAIGAPASPTPTGDFAVTDRLRTGDPTGPYGCCILALSATSPHAIQGWSGGNRIAIHSTPETSSIGLPVSHGCMRLTLPEGSWLIRHVPQGTPTIIRS